MRPGTQVSEISLAAALAACRAQLVRAAARAACVTPHCHVCSRAIARPCAVLARTAFNIRVGAKNRASGIINSISLAILAIALFHVAKFLPLPCVGGMVRARMPPRARACCAARHRCSGGRAGVLRCGAAGEAV